MPLYFAYGANMDRAAMAHRCPRSKPLGIGRLAGYRFFVFRQGYASVEPEAGSTVFGLLWELALADVPALDRYEELASGLYVKKQQLILALGSSRRALIYIGADREHGEAKPGYMEPLVAFAEALRFSESYLKDLRAWLPLKPPVRSAGSRRDL